MRVDSLHKVCERTELLHHETVTLWIEPLNWDHAAAEMFNMNMTAGGETGDHPNTVAKTI